MKIYQNWYIFQIKISGHWYFNKGYVCNIQERTSKSWADCNKHKYYTDLRKVCLCRPCCEVLFHLQKSRCRSTELQQTVYGSLFHITFSWSCFELFILASLSILKYWEPFTCFKILEAKILHHITYIPHTVKLFKEKNISEEIFKNWNQRKHITWKLQKVLKNVAKTLKILAGKNAPPSSLHTHIIRRPIM